MSCRKDRSPYEPLPPTNLALDDRGFPLQHLSTLGFASGKLTPKIGQLTPAGRAPPTFDGESPRLAAGITSGRLRSSRGIYRGPANGRTRRGAALAVRAVSRRRSGIHPMRSLV